MACLKKPAAIRRNPAASGLRPRWHGRHRWKTGDYLEEGLKRGFSHDMAGGLSWDSVFLQGFPRMLDVALAAVTEQVSKGVPNSAVP